MFDFLPSVLERTETFITDRGITPPITTTPYAPGTAPVNLAAGAIRRGNVPPVVLVAGFALLALMVLK